MVDEPCNDMLYTCWQFPAMRTLSIGSADAFILVYDVADAATFEEVRLIRDQIHDCKRTAAVPIVVVGNKSDSDAPREVRRSGGFLVVGPNPDVGRVGFM